MITFKTFLEAEVKPIVATHFQNDEALRRIVKQHCKKSLWMFQNLTPIWRGDRKAAVTLGEHGAGVVDTTKSSRTSQNTRNWYTLIIDNSPAYAHFPKRSQSLICTTRWPSAYMYAGSSENVVAVIPFDDAKIGWVGARDMWEKSVNIDGARESVLGMNDLFNNLESLGLDDTSWQSFLTFSEHLKTDAKMRETVEAELSDIGIRPSEMESWLSDFAGKVQHAYTDMGMTGLDTSQLASRFQTKFSSLDQPGPPFEMWVGGKVLCLSNEVFEELALWMTSP